MLEQQKITTSSELDKAKKVIAREAEGLALLSLTLENTFIQAVDILGSVKGRLIVTGMGKSGHIARKVAATLSSTGTASLFLHPGEASHGDLGMVTKEDAILAFSNSGETQELSDLLFFCKRFDVKLIGVTQRKESALSKAADVVLILPKVSEACPMGLAPTTSTTMALALGDALAVVLLERKGFTSKDFHDRHPGGKLGTKLLQVKEIMHKGPDLPLVTVDALMKNAVHEMTDKGFGVVGVMDEGSLVGIITDGDLRRHLGGPMLQTKVKKIMTQSPKTISKTTLAVEAVKIINQKKISSLFVVEEGKPVGLLHIHDLLRAGLM